ncbi:MAK10-like protein [Tanacetum coccineum]|uniref:MAK10-like protein n=1 Tax=Tanacetum coccineum TaxID=301880 RepID=A0ABQ5I119_9ASTR
MENENPIRTLGDYSKPSHEGYRNTIELPDGNNVVPLRSDTIRLVQNGCSFHGLRFEDPNQHLKDFLKLVDSLDLDVANSERTRLCLFQFSLRDQASNWLQRLPVGSIFTWDDLTTRFFAQFFLPGRTSKLRNDILMRTIDQSAGGKLHDKNAKESWALLEDLALYDNESWNDPRDFAKPVKGISLPQDVPREQDRYSSSPKRVHFINTITILSKEDEPRETKIVKSDTKGNDHDTIIKVEELEDEEKEEKDDPKYIYTNPPLPPDPSISFVTKVRKLNSFLESLNLVPPPSNTQFVCTKENEGDIMFVEIIKKYDDSSEDELEGDESAITEELEVEYFDIVEGCPSNMKIPCNIGHVLVEKGYIDQNSPMSVMTRIVKFTNGADEIAYKMPHNIDKFNSLSDLGKKHTKSVYFRNGDDKRRGVDYVMNKILGFYREYLDLDPNT